MLFSIGSLIYVNPVIIVQARMLQYLYIDIHRVNRFVLVKRRDWWISRFVIVPLLSARLNGEAYATVFPKANAVTVVKIGNTIKGNP